MSDSLKNKETEFPFDQVLDRDGLNFYKWEGTQANYDNPDLLCFGTAAMDFPIAPPIKTALSQVLERGLCSYALKPPEYYEAIQVWLERHGNWKIKKEWLSSNVKIYTAMVTLFLALSEPGDEIIYQPPVHFVFEKLIEANGRQAIANPLKLEAGTYRFDLEDLKAKITEKTKLLLLCNPANPVGRVWSVEELRELGELCVAKGITIISDDVYAGLVYPGQQYVPIASLDAKIAQATVTLLSPSKSFNLSGIYHALVICANETLLERYNNELEKLNLSFGSSVFGIAATTAAFNDGDQWLDELMSYLQGNLDYLKDYLEKWMPNLSFVQPEATYFVWLDCHKLGLSDGQLEDFFIKQTQVAVEFGVGFGTGGSGYIRFNVACSQTTLKVGLERIKLAYDDLIK